MLGHTALSEQPLSSLPAAAAQTTVNAAKINAAPQQTSAKEYAGYGVAFAALGALLAGTPPQAQASDYSVGTHQEAVASYQLQPVIFGQQPPTVTIATVVPKTQWTPEQAYDNVQPVLFGTQPPTASSVQWRTTVTYEQKYDQSGATLFGSRLALVTVVGTDVPVGVTKVSVNEQSYDTAYAKTWGPRPADADQLGGTDYVVGTHQESLAKYQLPAVVWGHVLPPNIVVDELPYKFRFSTYQEYDPAYGKVWGTAPPSAPTDIVNGVEYSVGTHQDAIAAMQPKPQTWGKRVVETAPGTDVSLTKFTFAAQEHVNSGFSLLFGQTPPDFYTQVHYYEADQQSTEQWGGRVWGTTPVAIITSPASVSKTFVAAPEQVPSGSAYVHGTAVAAPPGTDVAVSVTRTAFPQPYEDIRPVIKGQSRDYVYGTDVALTKFVFGYEQAYDVVQYGNLFSKPPESVAPESDALVRDGGYRINWQNQPKRKKRKPLPTIDKIIDDAVAEQLYKEIIETPEAKEAGSAVKPFSDDKRKSVPLPEQVDWDSVARDAETIGKILRLWREVDTRKRQLQDDEDWFMMGD